MNAALARGRADTSPHAASVFAARAHTSSRRTSAPTTASETPSKSTAPRSIQTQKLDRATHSWMSCQERANAAASRLAGIRVELGQALRRTREDIGLSRTDVARKSKGKLTIAKVAGMEFGHRFTNDELLMFLHALGISRLELRMPRPRQHGKAEATSGGRDTRAKAS